MSELIAELELNIARNGGLSLDRSQSDQLLQWLRTLTETVARQDEAIKHLKDMFDVESLRKLIK
jgi:hypothetical protein